MSKILEIENVSRTFSSGILHPHTVCAVDHVSFSIERGKTFGLVGNSGCGKTTLSRMIAKLLRVSEGKILFEGKNIADFNPKEEKEYHRKVQMVFQNPEASLDPSMKIRDSLMEALEIHKIGESREEREEKIQVGLKQVGLQDYLLSRYPHQISGGEGQRLVICRALLLKPEILILDEPTSMLDVSVQASIMNLLKNLQEELNLTYLYITHDIELLGWISHMIGVMQKGKLVEIEEKAKIMKMPSHPYTQQLIHAYETWGE